VSDGVLFYGVCHDDVSSVFCDVSCVFYVYVYELFLNGNVEI